MAYPTLVALLRKGADVWNAWRLNEPKVAIDLSGADFTRLNLKGVNLSEADLAEANFWLADLSGAKLIRTNLRMANLSNVDGRGADFSGSFLRGADLRLAKLAGANLSKADLGRATLIAARCGGANFSDAILIGADLSHATLQSANLSWANLSEANVTDADLSRVNLVHASLAGARIIRSRLRSADLREAILMQADVISTDLSDANLAGADLRMARMIETNLASANLSRCAVYGISAWGLGLTDETKQQNLVITAHGEPEITTDNIEVAQFIYLLLHNEKIRQVIDTITSKVVLILGRFTADRKPLLDALREELRKPGRGYVPVMFDFEKAHGQTTVETVTLLARMARFVIADLSDAKSVLQELQAIVPSSPMLAVQPLITSAQEEPGMFDFFAKYSWVLKTYRYDAPSQLIADLDENVIRPVEAKVLELRGPQP
jgi:uncharacterized protein YjbI with pentapeptide repeats